MDPWMIDYREDRKQNIMPIGGVPSAGARFHPDQWSRDEVRSWIKWCVIEYELSTDLPDQFQLNGKGLCMLTKDDCRLRAPRDGDVIYNSLSLLIQSGTASGQPHDTDSRMNLRQGTGSSPHNPPPPDRGLSVSCRLPHVGRPPQLPHEMDTESPSSGTEYKELVEYPGQHYDGYSARPQDEPVDLSHGAGSMSIRPPSTDYCDNISSTACEPSLPVFVLPPDELTSSCPATDISVPVVKSTQGCRLLWEFLAELLTDPSAGDFIRWDDEDTLTFRVVDPQQLADRWGREKGKGGMTYEKLSRALRYYYKTNIVAKVRGKRLTYRFLTAPQCIKRGTRGAKPGVPHKRRNLGPDAMSKSSSSSTISSARRKSTGQNSPSADSRPPVPGPLTSSPPPPATSTYDRQPSPDNVTGSRLKIVDSWTELSSSTTMPFSRMLMLTPPPPPHPPPPFQHHQHHQQPRTPHFECDFNYGPSTAAVRSFDDELDRKPLPVVRADLDVQFRDSYTRFPVRC